MKIKIEDLVTPMAAGPWRGTPAIIDNGEGKPKQVALLLQGEGRTINMVLECPESIGLGQMLMVLGCVGEGGPPPMIRNEEAPPAPLLIVGSNRSH